MFPVLLVLLAMFSLSAVLGHLDGCLHVPLGTVEPDAAHQVGGAGEGGGCPDVQSGPVHFCVLEPGARVEHVLGHLLHVVVVLRVPADGDIGPWGSKGR